MNKIGKNAMVLVMALTCYARLASAQTVSFDAQGGDIQSLVNDLKDTNRPGPGNHGGNNQQPQHPQPGPQPQHPQPGPQPGPHPGPHPGPQPWNPPPGPHPGPQPWNPPPPPPHPYEPVYSDMNCQTWEFTAQTPNTRTENITGEEQSFDCYTDNNGTRHCRPTGKYFNRKITVNIGDRKLESWEKESLKVCLESPSSPRLDLAGMLYQYTVASKDNSGFLGFDDSTEFTLTPGAKKPSNPDSKEISLAAVEVSPAGGVVMTLNDTRAEYFKGEKITINADGMNIPTIDPNMPVDDILNSFVTFKVSGTFDVGPTYALKLMDAPKPGKYIVTVKFTRMGPLSSGQSAQTTEGFDLK